MPKYRKIYKGARNLKIMTLSRKVLRVDGKKSIPGCSSADNSNFLLYPNGTRRFVEEIYLFPRTRDGIKSRYWILEQEAIVTSWCSPTDNISGDCNEWKTLRYLRPQIPSSE